MEGTAEEGVEARQGVVGENNEGSKRVHREYAGEC
jgi:hypothetical protein